MKRIKNCKGEGYVNSGVKVLIAVVIGALVLGGIYTVQKNVIMKNASDKIEELFNYNGSINSMPSATYGVRRISSQTVSSDDYMTVVIDIPYDDFDYCTVDGVDISGESCITPCEEYGYLSFIAMPPYLEKLSAGSHTLRAYAKDGGFGEVTFFIE